MVKIETSPTGDTPQLAMTMSEIPNDFLEGDGIPHGVDTHYVKSLLRLGMIVDNPDHVPEIMAIQKRIFEAQTANDWDAVDEIWGHYAGNYSNETVGIITDILQWAEARMQYRRGYGSEPSLQTDAQFRTVHGRVAHAFVEFNDQLKNSEAIKHIIHPRNYKSWDGYMGFLAKQGLHPQGPLFRGLVLVGLEHDARTILQEHPGTEISRRSNPKNQFQPLDTKGKYRLFTEMILGTDSKPGTEFIRGYHRLAETIMWNHTYANWGPDHEMMVIALRAVKFRKSGREKTYAIPKLFKALKTSDVELARIAVIEDILRFREDAYDVSSWLHSGVHPTDDDNARSFIQRHEKVNDLATAFVEFEKSIHESYVYAALGIDMDNPPAKHHLLRHHRHRMTFTGLEDGYAMFRTSMGFLSASGKVEYKQITTRYPLGHLLDRMSMEDYWSVPHETQEEFDRRKQAIDARPRIPFEFVKAFMKPLRKR